MKKKTKIALGVVGTICVIGGIGNSGGGDGKHRDAVTSSESSYVSEIFDDVTEEITTIEEILETTEKKTTEAPTEKETPEPTQAPETQPPTQKPTQAKKTEPVTQKPTEKPVVIQTEPVTVPKTTQPPATKPAVTTPPATTPPATEAPKQPATEEKVSVTVYRTKSGKKYHYENPCGNGTYYACTLEEAINAGLEACEKCVLH